jgi:GAF domain-containing protein
VQSEAEVARAMVQLSDSLAVDFDEVRLGRILVDRCVELLDLDSAGVVLVAPRGGPRVVVSPSDGAGALHDLVRLELSGGPGADCLRTGQPVDAPSLTASGAAWPRFTTEAIALGFRSVCTIPLRMRETVVGTLSLFRRTDGPLHPRDRLVAEAFADVATIAILQHRAASQARSLNDNLTAALESRIVIEQAKGVLAERLGCHVDAAFALLRNHARNHNLRLAELSRRIVSGSFDARWLDPPRG